MQSVARTQLHPHLQLALQWSCNPICIEIDFYGTPTACIRSSNSLSLLRLEEHEARAVFESLTRLLGLDPSGRKHGFAQLRIDDEPFQFNICPQLGGVIGTLHRLRASQEAASVNSDLPGQQELPSEPAEASTSEHASRVPLLLPVQPIQASLPFPQAKRSWLRELLAQLFNKR
ncbi:hypothetical protein HZ992_14740 [Rhizobacter sp. AJA081-3]|uniref:hypothetical protein n=1 Tax=Rhizobacter sp. AJA081-3 TaxID=2753607 RepID=UPI001AE063BB|nr:hypothetical protein [Rhizobacter sp. AJA081-3]QTN21441.1 hypothetical protein HZ992_14740 [Rhizobacter sp. AJA081-3]